MLVAFRCGRPLSDGAPAAASSLVGAGRDPVPGAAPVRGAPDPVASPVPAGAAGAPAEGGAADPDCERGMLLVSGALLVSGVSFVGGDFGSTVEPGPALPHA